MGLFEEIQKQLAACVATNTEDIVPENGNAYFGLPKPYSVPTPGDCFHEMYYWDTYFTNVGLLAVGNVEQAKNNAECILSLIHRFGYMPNGSRTIYLPHSQPPFFAQIVKEVFEADQDLEFLGRAYDGLVKEHNYFTQNRSFDNGLNHYGYYAVNENLKSTRAGAWKKRTGLEPDRDLGTEVGNFIGYCESGWDCNPRLGNHSYLYASPDLNALVWNLESRLAEFSKILNKQEEGKWKAAADCRCERMNRYLWNEKEGYFADYNVESKEFGKVFSAAAFYPLFFGVATREQARLTVEKLSRIEYPYGVVACEKNHAPGQFQWDYPNIWPCLQWIVIHALQNYGYEEDALRIARNYVDMLERVEEKTGQFWEKYNAETGMQDAGVEYQTPPMMGWTAGIYLKCKTLLKK